jgi:hypothetical protein
MKRWVLATLVITAVLLTACTAPSTSSGTTIPPQSAAIEITAGELYAAYEANQVAADAQYKDKILKVTGVVDSIGKDILDTPYITLTSGGKYEMWGVQCMFDEKYEPELAKLTKGQTVTVQGKCDGYLVNVLLRDCALASSAPALFPTPTPTSTSVVYRISGTAKTVDITFNNDTGGTEQYSDIKLPYEISYEDFQDDFLYISAQNNGESGSVIVIIEVNGETFKTSKSEGAFVIASASGSKP